MTVAEGVRPSGVATWLVRPAALVAVAGVTLAYVLTQEPFRSAALAGGVVLGVGALSVNVLVGYAGQLSLGHQAFVGIGAFTSALLVGRAGQPFAAGLAAATAVGAAQAVVLGLVALRVRGLYFGLVTLAWGLVAENSLFRLRAFTGGGAGQEAPRPAGFATDRAYLVLCVLLLAVVLLVDWRLVRTKAGRALQALREDPRIAAGYGVDVRAYTLLAFAVAGAYAGLAGALLAARDTRVVAANFTFQTVALPYLVVAVVGGLGRRGGIVTFALLVVLAGEHLPEIAARAGVPFVAENDELLIQLASGLLAVATLVFRPDGLGALTAAAARWMRGGPLRSDGSAGRGTGTEAPRARP